MHLHDWSQLNGNSIVGAVHVLRLLCEVVVVVMSSRLIILVAMDTSGKHCAYSSNSQLHNRHNYNRGQSLYTAMEPVSANKTL